ncbi:MAG: tetratricopeptide repeat protein [Chitinophagaceae bacterium]|nr:tetratricopeptide repeat protein [Chitinophagaceae bacterium]
MKHRFLFLFILFVIGNKAFTQKVVIDSLQQINSPGKGDKEQVLALNKLASELLRTDAEKAKTILHEAVRLGVILKNARTLSTSYSTLVTILQNSGKPDSAVYYLELLHMLSDEATGPDAGTIKRNYNSTAGLFHKKSGNPRLALSYFKAIANLRENDDDKTTIAGNLLNIGNTYRDMADYKNALTYHLEALKYFEEAGNKRGESFCYQSISNSFAELKQYENALNYSKKAIQLKTELGDKRGLGTAQDGLGNIYLGLNKYDKALQHFTASLIIAKELNLLTEQSKTYFNIGKVHAANNNAKAAILNFKQSKLLSDQLGDKATSSAADIELLALQKNAAMLETETKMISSLNTFTQTGGRSKEAGGYKKLADFYEANGQHDKALIYTNKYYRLNDSIQNNELQLQLKKMEEQYTVEKKENEITLLKKDQQLNVAKLEKQKAFQYGSVIFFALLLLTAFLIINRYRVMQRAKRQIEIEKMRNSIARDLHDDIGSTITGINILSNVLLKQQDDPKAMYSNLQKIKENSVLIMESMSDIVWAINPLNDTVEKIIYRMREFAAEILEPLNIKFHFKTTGDIAAVKLDPSKRKDFFLIYKEAINNAAKYSRCSNIEIVVKYDGKNLYLHITDDGEGFDEATNRKGNGLRNIRERAKEMPALLHYETVIGNGTSVILDVPLT